MAAVLLEGVFVALLRPGQDAVRRVGEPDAVVGAHHQVIGRVETAALIAVGEGDDAAVGFGAADAAGAVFAGDEAALAVEGVAVAVVGGLAKGLDAAGGRPAQHAIVGDVAPDHAVVRQPDRPLGPYAAVRQMLQARLRQQQFIESLVEDLDSLSHNFLPRILSARP